MPMRLTARHCEIGGDLKRHVETRSRHFGRFFENIIDLHWLVEVNKHRHLAEVSAKVYGTLLTGKGGGADLRTAVDQAADKMEAQLKKYKDRLKQKDTKTLSGAKTDARRLRREAD